MTWVKLSDAKKGVPKKNTRLYLRSITDSEFYPIHPY